MNMNATGKIWVALDTTREKALKIVAALAKSEKRAAIAGLKLNRLIDGELFWKGEGPGLFEALSKFDFPLWADVKLHDVDRTVAARAEPYVKSGFFQFITVMAKGEIEMMAAAVRACGYEAHVIAVTELTSLDEEQINLGSGKPAKASVINLARNAVLAGVEFLVCSGKELEVLRKRPELTGKTVPGLRLNCITPAITPAWKQEDAAGQKRTATPVEVLKKGAHSMVIGSAIVKAENPLEAFEKTVAEIEAVEDEQEKE